MDSKTYWERREEEALKNRIKDEKEYQKRIDEIYADMLDGVQKEIDSFYSKYAEAEGISLAEAKKRVSKADIEAYERKAKRYVKDKDFSAKANEEMRLYNATMKINRLEMLKANIGLELIKGHAELETFMGEILQGRTEDELKRQAGILGNTVKNNSKLVESIVNASFHNAKFSDRIWMYQDSLKGELSKIIQSGLIQGKSSKALAKELRKTVNTSVFNSERLMRSELARVQTEAQKKSFEQNGFKEYTFLANSGCCDNCQSFDGKHFKVEKMVIGENAPPLHPQCRCSTSAWEDSKEYDEWLDYLSKGGTTAEWNIKKRRIIQSGGRYAVGSIEWIIQREAVAKKHYDKIRMTDDIEAVAKNSSMSVEDIRIIKNHIFFEKHIKYDGSMELFDADYDIAVAWNRLAQGIPEERDLLLLRHELLESMVEKKYNLTAAEAHEIAEASYAWDKKLIEDLGDDGEKDGLL